MENVSKYFEEIEIPEESVKIDREANSVNMQVSICAQQIRHLSEVLVDYVENSLAVDPVRVASLLYITIALAEDIEKAAPELLA